MYTFFAVLMWSFIPVVSTLGGKSLGVDSFLLISNLLSSLAIVPFVDFRELFGELNLRYLLNSLLLSVLGIFGYYYLLYYAYMLSDNPVNVLVLQYLWPVFIALLSVFLLGEKMGAKKIIALLFGFISAFLVITKGRFSFSANSTSLVLALVASFSFALYSVLSKKRTTKNPSNDIFVYFFISFILSLILFLAKGEKLDIKGDEYLYLFLNGIFINGISYLFWIWALKVNEASKLSVLTLFTPLISIAWINLFLHEPMRFIYLVALILSVLSGCLSIKSGK
ncbi:MAG: DMT family transporter [Epsilonproteobacteria bacterium]|nr:DMT family transporter [Campylobacterota bacterium]